MLFASKYPKEIEHTLFFVCFAFKDTFQSNLHIYFQKIATYQMISIGEIGFFKRHLFPKKIKRSESKQNNSQIRLKWYTFKTVLLVSSSLTHLYLTGIILLSHVPKS